MRPFMRRFRRLLRQLPTLWPLAFVIIGTVAVILWGRGYRPNPKEKTIAPTGLISANSDPIGSEVYVDNVLKTATNNTITIDPGWYQVKIEKDGYIPWEKKIRVQGEVVTSIDPFLFPANPSLSPLTTVGIENPVVSPDGTKIAYVIPVSTEQNGVSKKAGLWVYELIDRSLGFNRDQRQVGASTATFNFSTSKITWAPDSTQILVDTGKSIRLYNANRTDDFQDVTFSAASVTANWEAETQQLERQKLAAFKQEIIDVATSSAKILSFSPDESKILYEATAAATIPELIKPPLIGANSTEQQRSIEVGKIYVYDSREDKNYYLLDKKELPTEAVPSTRPSPSPAIKSKTSPSPTTTYNLQPASLHWFPTSRHLVLTLPGKIDILEYDRTNWVTVYSGPFIEGFMAPYPNGSRIIVMTNLNPGVSKLPNLYTVNLR